MADHRSGPRIAWSDYEQDTLYTEAKKLWEGPAKGQSLLNLVKFAQVVLPEARRRQLISISNVPGELRKRFLTAGIGSVSPLFKGLKVDQAPSKEELRIQQLADERDAANAAVEPLRAENRSLRAELNTFKLAPKPPSEMDILKNFLADVLYLAEAKGKAIIKPAVVVSEPPSEQLLAVVPPVVAPKHDPFRGYSNGGPRKFKVAIVGGEDYSYLHNEVKDLYDMRYFDTRSQSNDGAGVGERLRAFKDPLHGKVIVIVNQTNHQAVASLKYQNVPFVPFTGNRGELIAKLKSGELLK